MGDVIQLHSPERLVYLCGVCGCSTFRLYNDETSECAGCGAISCGGVWVTPLQDAPERPDLDNGDAIDVVAIGSPELAKRRVLKRIEAGASHIALMACWFRDGSMTAWSDIETDEQRQWACRKLADLQKSLAAREKDSKN